MYECVGRRFSGLDLRTTKYRGLRSDARCLTPTGPTPLTHTHTHTRKNKCCVTCYSMACAFLNTSLNTTKAHSVNSFITHNIYTMIE